MATPKATIKCRQCRERVNLDFQRAYAPERWEGTCPCGALNYISVRPGWELPIFTKYTREYLSEVTGYSKAHLSRIATGRLSLGQVFIDRCCYKLGETEEVLFSPAEEALNSVSRGTLIH